jgi:hypothetical protein
VPVALPWAIACIPVVATVATFGELSIEAFVAVLAIGCPLVASALLRRAGSAATPAGPGAFAWLGWLVAVALWELALAWQHGAYPTLSDLADPVLAHPAARAVATLGWLATGLWLLRRPTVQERR